MSSAKTKLKLGDNYLSGQIITYMGNKRKLLPVISELIDKIKTELNSTTLTIGDGFAGSGIVSRLLKTKATKLYTNDLAGYSKTLNECYLATPNEQTLQNIKMYIDTANLRAGPLANSHINGAEPPANSHINGGEGAEPPANSHINGAEPPANSHINGGEGAEPPWISGNWAPAAPTITEKDRVYFTYENGKRIDSIRNYIDTIPLAYRSFVLAPLLVECSIHNNTNGQFSAFYKDKTASKGAYGGKNGIDIKRIAKPITVPYPLFDLTHLCETIITQLDTNVWAKNLANETKVDIVYYDPPYNKHPYNIYYFLLDIINTWDKTIPISDTNRGQTDDRKKSLYNSMSKAKDAMDDLIQNTKANYIILSYNDGGIIPIPVLDAMLAKHGQSVEKYPIDHKTYNRLKGISNYKRTKEYKPVKEIMYVIKK